MIQKKLTAASSSFYYYDSENLKGRINFGKLDGDDDDYKALSAEFLCFTRVAVAFPPLFAPSSFSGSLPPSDSLMIASAVSSIVSVMLSSLDIS